MSEKYQKTSVPKLHSVRFKSDEKYRYGFLQTQYKAYIVRDDGYKIEARVVEMSSQGGTLSDWFLWAEYKHCELPSLGFALANVFMNSLEKVR